MWIRNRKHDVEIDFVKYDQTTDWGKDICLSLVDQCGHTFL